MPQPAVAQRVSLRDWDMGLRLTPEMLVVGRHVKQTLRLASRVFVMMESPCTSTSFAVC